MIELGLAKTPLDRELNIIGQMVNIAVLGGLGMGLVVQGKWLFAVSYQVLLLIRGRIVL